MMSTSLQNTGVFLLLLILAWTGLGTHDSLTWLMEVTPVIIIVPLLLVTRSRYRSRRFSTRLSSSTPLF
jgi:putative membrane protein